MSDKIMYKTELHCHTSEVSHCAGEDAEATVEKYLKYGYKTIVLTNHLTPWYYDTPEFEGKSWKEEMDHYIGGYRKMCKCAEGTGLNILLGAEIRFPAHENDYLFFGADEDFFYNNEDFTNTTVGEFHEITLQKGYILIQAHPFRRGMHIILPWEVDGWEVYNGHPGQISSNEAAEAYAAQYPSKHKTSGTDHHDADHYPAGGLLTEYEIKTSADLIAALHRGDYELIKEEDIRTGKKRL